MTREIFEDKLLQKSAVLKRYASILAKDNEYARDLYQECMLVCLEKFDKFDEERASVYTFASLVMRSCHKDLMYKFSRFPIPESQVAIGKEGLDVSESWLEHIHSHNPKQPDFIMLEKLERYISEESVEFQFSFNLSMEGYKYIDIDRLLKCKEGRTVDVIRQGTDRIKKKIKGEKTNARRVGIDITESVIEAMLKLQRKVL